MRRLASLFILSFSWCALGNDHPAWNLADFTAAMNTPEMVSTLSQLKSSLDSNGSYLQEMVLAYAKKDPHYGALLRADSGETLVKAFVPFAQAFQSIRRQKLAYRRERFSFAVMLALDGSYFQSGTKLDVDRIRNDFEKNVDNDTRSWGYATGLAEVFVTAKAYLLASHPSDQKLLKSSMIDAADEWMHETYGILSFETSKKTTLSKELERGRIELAKVLPEDLVNLIFSEAARRFKENPESYYAGEPNSSLGRLLGWHLAALTPAMILTTLLAILFTPDTGLSVETNVAVFDSIALASLTLEFLLRNWSELKRATTVRQACMAYLKIQ